jgi:hypothetical protein
MKRTLLLVAALSLFVVAASYAVAAEPKREVESTKGALQNGVVAPDQRNLNASAIIHNHTQFVVGMGTLSLINAGLAQSKRRSGLAWWLLSLFLGPIATFLIVVLDKIEPTPPTSQGASPCDT